MNPFTRAFGIEYEFVAPGRDPYFFRGELNTLEGNDSDEWHCHYDNDDLIECASPITRFGVNDHAHEYASDLFNECGYAADPSYGGMHVHIDLRDLTSITNMAKLQLTVATFDAILLMIVHPQRLTSGWCRPSQYLLTRSLHPNQKLHHSVHEAYNTSIYKQSISLIPDRFFTAIVCRKSFNKLYEKPIFVRTNRLIRQRTIEFRMHESCIDWSRAKKWVKLLQIIVQEGKSSRGLREQRLWSLFQSPYSVRIRALTDLVHKYDKNLCPMVEQAHDRIRDTRFMRLLEERVSQ